VALPAPNLGGLARRWRNRHYADPFRHAESLQVGRVDQGVDYHGVGRIDAIGRCRIVGFGGSGWPGGEYLLYRLLRGRHKGRFVYVAEAVEPTCRVGQTVRRGQMVAAFGPNAAPGMSPGIETGWGSPVLNETLARSMGNVGGPDHANSPAGLCFARFLHNIGARAPVVLEPHGREYPV
jgi:hypothetical protein